MAGAPPTGPATSVPSDWRAHIPALRECYARHASGVFEKTREPPWLEITKESWWEALEVLPPEDWIQGNLVNSFLLMEKSGDLADGTPTTECFARYRNRYFVTLIPVSEHHAGRLRLAEHVGVSERAVPALVTLREKAAAEAALHAGGGGVSPAAGRSTFP